MWGGIMRLTRATFQFTTTSLLHPKYPTTTSIISPIFSTFPKLSPLAVTQICPPISVNQHKNQTMSVSSNTNTCESEWNYSESDIAHKFFFFNVLKDGRVHVLPTPFAIVPPSFGSAFGVAIKDVEINSDVSVRVFLPSATPTTEKLPVLLYVHGGGFCKLSAFAEDYTRFCSQIAADAKVLVVSVEYGLFPKRPLPACYDDSWAALQWLASHGNGSGPESWINNHADLSRIFVGGDSAGGNISHTVLAKVGSMGLNGDAKVEGMILIHPYFGEDDKMYMYMFPTNEGPQDPRMKPAVEDLARLGCDRVLVLLAENDVLYGAGKMYADELVKSGWKGKLEIMESKEKDHCFHFSNHTDLEAVAIRQRITYFIRNQGMDSCKNEDSEVAKEFIFFSILKDGTFVPRFRHLMGEKIPPVDDTVTATGVKIKDVEISPDVSARVFLPRGTCTSNKLPLLLYIHGGGFCMESAFSVVYTRYVSNLVAEANVVAVSVEYGLYPKRPIPACYEDSWAALQWVASHGKGCGPDPWINDYADLQRIFVGGDSAGGNISHTLLARVGSIGLPEDVRVEGMILVHPFFGIDGKDDEMWLYMCPTNEGPSDRRMKPNVEDLARIGCGRVLVLVAEKDHLIGAGKGYVDDLIKSGWNGTVEIVENKGKKHCFHTHNLEDEDAVANVQRIKSFIHCH